MEDILKVYTRPYDPLRPQICMDETSKQLLRDASRPLPMEPGRVERRDYEYERGGVVNVFMFFEPLEGRRWVEVTERRTKVDWAHQIKELVDERYPQAQQIVLVMDNLTPILPPPSFEAFDPTEARRLAEKLESTTPPNTASWLNMAEIELSVLSRQCLDRRVPDFETLEAEVSLARAARRERGKIEWRFSTDDARIKLKRLYPSLQE